MYREAADGWSLCKWRTEVIRGQLEPPLAWQFFVNISTTLSRVVFYLFLH